MVQEAEVLPHVPDAWIDEAEIYFNRHLRKYTLSRPLEEIEAELKQIEKEIAEILAEMTE